MKRAIGLAGSTAAMACSLVLIQPQTADAQVFVQQTGVANPFNGVDVGYFSAPAFVNIDNDGDLDAVVGEQNGKIIFYKNTGTASLPVFTLQTGSSNPLNGVEVGDNSMPAFVDIDGDGDTDLFPGNRDGLISYYKNTGTASAPVFTLITGTANPLNGIDVGQYSAPAFADIDGDGDQDAFIGESEGHILYYKNTGTTSSPAFTMQSGSSNPFNGVDLGLNTAPVFVNLDGDGDLDAFIGESSGNIFYYKNTGTASMPVFTPQTGSSNPFNGVNAGGYSTPAFADIDADGDQDSFIGESYGAILYYKNIQSPPCTNPAIGGTIAASQTICIGMVPAAFTSSAPANGQTDTLEYKWQLSVAGVSSGFNDIGSTNSETYSPGSLSMNTWFKRLARVTCKPDWTGAAESNVVQVAVQAILPVGVSIAASANPVNSGTPVTFSATPVNGGLSPGYQWFVNGASVGTNSSSFSYTPLNGDVVTCLLISGELCTSSNPANSNIISMVVTTVPLSLDLQDITIPGNQCFNAVNTINVAGNGNYFIVQPGGVTTMIAGQNILFYPGTVVEQGGYLNGYIAPAGPWCLPPGDATMAGTNTIRPLTEQPFYNIFPNPTSGRFTLELNIPVADPGDGLVEIYDMKGRKISSENLAAGWKYELSLSGQPNGLYLLQLFVGKYNATARIIRHD